MGHLRRMQALSAALATRGIGAALVDSAAGAQGPIVVVDSYHRRADDRGWFRGDLIIAVEDLDRDQSVDIAVEPFPAVDRVGDRRAGLVLAGPSYALVDPVLARIACLPVGPEVRRVLVTGGGADTAGWGMGVARALRAELPASTGIALVKRPCSADGALDGVECIWTTDGLGPTLAGADLVVTAAGVTMLESLVLGRPTVAAVLFPNQERQARASQAAGAIILAALDDAAATAVALARDTERRLALAVMATQLLDGLGADRVAEVICEHR